MKPLILKFYPSGQDTLIAETESLHFPRPGGRIILDGVPYQVRNVEWFYQSGIDQFVVEHELVPITHKFKKRAIQPWALKP